MLLAANYRDAAHDPRLDAFPLVRLFNPQGAAAWLGFKMHEDEGILNGLADLGFGDPEPGLFSLREIEAVDLPPRRMPGRRIKLGPAFTTRHRLSVWTEAARAPVPVPEAAALPGGPVSDDVSEDDSETSGALRLLFRDRGP
ncbi:hypothetical protein BES08_06215 [Novosphingobium resinovorum]|uniref:DUF2958 domain-containing protein n=1 Tax=Novosphingobium resinovorum TaxID=158500 RepID=A0A1D8A2U7_9SPHN|nr:hypothetical protein BES08_06215 [Novosphingobium resinovorum]